MRSQPLGKHRAVHRADEGPVGVADERQLSDSPSTARSRSMSRAVLRVVTCCLNSPPARWQASSRARCPRQVREQRVRRARSKRALGTVTSVCRGVSVPYPSGRNRSGRSRAHSAPKCGGSSTPCPLSPPGPPLTARRILGGGTDRWPQPAHRDGDPRARRVGVVRAAPR